MFKSLNYILIEKKVRLGSGFLQVIFPKRCCSTSTSSTSSSSSSGSSSSSSSVNGNISGWMRYIPIQSYQGYKYRRAFFGNHVATPPSIIPSLHPLVRNLFLGFIAGIIASSILNREFSSHEKKLRRQALNNSDHYINANAKVQYALYLLEQVRDFSSVSSLLPLSSSSSSSSSSSPSLFLKRLRQEKNPPSHPTQAMIDEQERPFTECVQTIYMKNKKDIAEHSIKLSKRNRKYLLLAYQLLTQASELGNVESHYHLGQMHLRNEILNASTPKAAYHHFKYFVEHFDEYFRKLERHRSTHNPSDIIYMYELLDDAKFQLAMCYLNGYGIEEDEEEGGREEEKKSLHSSPPQSQKYIDKGMHILEVDLYKKHKYAAFELFKIYREGRYQQEIKPMVSLSWLREASQLGHASAIHYFNQLCVSKGKKQLDQDIADLSTLY